MSFSTSVSFRYLKANRDNRYFSWIAFLSVFGVAIGVAVMIVVLSVIDGFEHELRNRFLSTNAHILVYRYPAGLNDAEVWEKGIQKDFAKEVKATAPFIQADTMIKSAITINAILIRGIDPKKRNKVQKITESVHPLKSLNAIQSEVNNSAKGQKLPDVPSIILGKGLLSLLQAKIGDTIHVVMPSDAEGIATPYMPFKVVGTYESGLQIYDNKLGVISIPAAQKLLSRNVVTGIEVGLHNPEESEKIADKMLEKYNLSVKEWKSYNRNAFEAIKEQKYIIGLIVWLVAVVAGLNILTTLFISINQKQKEISILKALGASSAQIMILFLKQTFMIGGIGATFGVALAFVLGKIIERYEIIKIPEVYMLARLPVEYDWKVYVIISISSLFLCLFAGLYPSWAATRVMPTEGFKGIQS